MIARSTEDVCSGHVQKRDKDYGINTNHEHNLSTVGDTHRIKLTRHFGLKVFE